jgi:hypothetical protein
MKQEPGTARGPHGTYPMGFPAQAGESETVAGQLAMTMNTDLQREEAQIRARSASSRSIISLLERTGRTVADAPLVTSGTFLKVTSFLIAPVSPEPGPIGWADPGAARCSRPDR